MYVIFLYIYKKSLVLIREIGKGPGKEVGGTEPPPGRVWDGMLAYIKNRSVSINPVIYLIRLLCLQVYIFWCSATLPLQPFKIWLL